MNKKKITGYIIIITGFLIILYTAVNYIFNLKSDTPFGAIGIILVAVGMGLVRKSSGE